MKKIYDFSKGKRGALAKKVSIPRFILTDNQTNNKTKSLNGTENHKEILSYLKNRKIETVILSDNSWTFRLDNGFVFSLETTPIWASINMVFEEEKDNVKVKKKTPNIRNSKRPI